MNKKSRMKTVVFTTAIVVLSVLGGALASSVAHAAGGGAALDTPRIDSGNKKSLQRGARIFVNYCLGCHSADYHRYGRMARDLGLSEEEVLENMIFTTDDAGERTKIGSLMTNTMSKDYGVEAFGVQPPNLALIARSRGIDWVYTYLRSFYLDDTRPMGVNNMVFPGASMPHVLWEMQGWQKPIYEEDDEGHKHWTGEYELVKEGSMSPEEYNRLAADLTNFLGYLADPVKEARHRIGMWVILFLLVLAVVSYMLKKEYWKDVV